MYQSSNANIAQSLLSTLLNDLSLSLSLLLNIKTQILWVEGFVIIEGGVYGRNFLQRECKMYSHIIFYYEHDRILKPRNLVNEKLFVQILNGELVNLLWVERRC